LKITQVASVFSLVQQWLQPLLLKWTDGNEYPLANVDVSSASHPFFTGQEKVMDTAGRVERFKARAALAADKRKKR